MPRGRRGPHGGGGAAVPRRLILLAALLAVAGACSEDPPPTFGFTVEAEPLEKVEAYGQIVPFRFTIESASSVPVFVHRVEALVGWRRELKRLTWKVSLALREDGGTLVAGPAGTTPEEWVVRTGLLLPDGRRSIEIPYRVVDSEERVLFTYEAAPVAELSGRIWLPEPGRGQTWRLGTRDAIDELLRAREPVTGRILLRPPEVRSRTIEEDGARVKISCPRVPFDPELDAKRHEGWTYSLALGGFVVRLNSSDFQLHREEGLSPLPPVPLDFFADLDREPLGVAVVTARGRIRTVRPEEAAEFLAGLLAANRRLGFANEPDRAKFEIKD
ncbi:MAG: hypothetical protein ACYS99_08505 [Planctomycetota bacterium]